MIRGLLCYLKGCLHYMILSGRLCHTLQIMQCKLSYYTDLHYFGIMYDKSWGIELVLFAMTKSCHFNQSTCRSLRLMFYKKNKGKVTVKTIFTCNEVQGIKNAKVSKRKSWNRVVCSLLGPLKTVLDPLKTILLSMNGERNIGLVCISKIMPIPWAVSCLVWFWE